MAKKLLTWYGLEAGTKFKIIKKTNGHNYPLNKEFTMSRPGEPFADMNNIALEYPAGNSLRISDIVIVTPSTVKELIAEKVKLSKEYDEKIEELDRKISFCEETGSETYDEQEEKVYSSLKLINDKCKTDIEKARELVKLINGVSNGL